MCGKYISIVMFLLEIPSPPPARLYPLVIAVAVAQLAAPVAPVGAAPAAVPVLHHYESGGARFGDSRGGRRLSPSGASCGGLGPLGDGSCDRNGPRQDTSPHKSNGPVP